MKRFYSLRTFAPIALTLTLALGGCATTSVEGEEDVASASEAASETRPNPTNREAKFGPHHGGELLAIALHDLDISPEQRKVIEGALDKLHDGEHGGMMALGKTLAEGVRAGKIDEAAVKAKEADLEKQAAQKRASIAEAINTLHATLTQKQRDTLVARLEEHMSEHGPFGKHAGRGPMPPHDAEGSAQKPEGPDGEKHEAMRHGKHGAMGPMGPMGILLHGIELRDEQRAQIKQALEANHPERPSMEEMQKKHEEMRAERKAMLDAFRAEKFDAAKALPENAMKPPFEHLVKALGAIVPVLDADQREELAQRIEKGPARMPFAGPPRHGDKRRAQEQ